MESWKVGEIGEQQMIHVNGEPFRCDCGGNVFTRVGELRYECNSCHSRYIGEKTVVVLAKESKRF